MATLLSNLFGPRSLRTRVGLIAGLGAAAVLGAFLLPAIPQSKRYHAFVDNRRMFGIPNFLDVASNAPFALAGALGLWLLHRKRKGEPLDEGEKRAFSVLFTGSVLLSLGSGYYHLAPNNARLVWDRLPMTVIFMSLFSIAIGERVDPKLGRSLLVPLLAAGAASVFYWRATDDLRFYGLVQFYPAAALPLMLLLLPARATGTKYMVLALGAYGVAKASETFDTPIYYALGRTVSGHTLKHLFAAGSVYFLARMAEERSPLPDPAPEAKIQGNAASP
jgi:hypothetical protein